MNSNIAGSHLLEKLKGLSVARISNTTRVLLVFGVLAASIMLPTAGIFGLQSVTTVAARGGGGGGGGGQPPVTLPPDWPATVPVPAGALQQTTGVSPHWILQLVADGNYPDVMQSIRQLYTSNGFVELNPQTAPYFFENDLYRVSVIGAARDHSPTKTNVNVYLDRK